MTAPFADTNVLVYALDRRDPRKQAAARAVLDADPPPMLSPQVLREFTATSVSKFGVPISRVSVMVRALAAQVTIVEDALLVVAAVDAATRWQLSVSDALIVEAARRGGCTRLLSEDLQAGMDFDGVVVENPFAES